MGGRYSKLYDFVRYLGNEVGITLLFYILIGILMRDLQKICAGRGEMTRKLSLIFLW